MLCNYAIDVDIGACVVCPRDRRPCFRPDVADRHFLHAHVQWIRLNAFKRFLTVTIRIFVPFIECNENEYAQSGSIVKTRVFLQPNISTRL